MTHSGAGIPGTNISGANMAAEVRYVDIRRGKPPSATLYFDIRLRNTHAEPRWFLLPRSLDAGRQTGRPGSVTRAEVYEYGASGTGRIRLGEFYGTEGFSALLLPAGADVTLHRFPVATMHDPARLPKVTVPLLIARRMEIGGESAETWFGGSALSDKTAELTLDQRKKLYAHESSNSVELEVTLADEERLALEVPVR
jgi:hypothetical protein